jgi:hypothetical protein
MHVSNFEYGAMTPYTQGDGLPGPEGAAAHLGIERAAPRNELMAGNKVECNACPVLCQISEGRVGACDRYANQNGVLVRLDPVVMLSRQTKDPTTQTPEKKIVLTGGNLRWGG